MSSTSPISLTARNHLWRRLDAAVAGHAHLLSTPTAVVDLDAFDANAADLVRRAGGVPIRVASKSLRVPALVRRALDHDGFAGVLGFTLHEALHLVASGVSDDVVVAYPTVDRGALSALLESPTALGAVTLMVDDVAQLDVIDQVRAGATPRGSVRICLDVDAGLHAVGAHVGPRRSPLRSASDAAALAEHVVNRPGLALVGVMTYEGQVAGLADALPGPRSVAVRAIKRASVAQLATRRRAVVEALTAIARDPLEFFNAGGSGSIETSAQDPSVTEVTAGSGLLVPRLFDHYQSFAPRPAAFFGLPVTRRPTAEIVTVHGGGLIASGPVGSDRAPLPWAPPGLELTALEGAGEVQTPLTGAPASSLRIGDLVWFRHSKSGELFEHVNDVHLIAGSQIVETVPSYRGQGQAF